MLIIEIKNNHRPLKEWELPDIDIPGLDIGNLIGEPIKGLIVDFIAVQFGIDEDSAVYPILREVIMAYSMDDFLELVEGDRDACRNISQNLSEAILRYLTVQLKNNIEDAIGGDKGGRGQLGKAMTDTLNKTLTDMGDPLTRNLARFICSSEVMKVIKTKVSDLVPGF